MRVHDEPRGEDHDVEKDEKDGSGKARNCVGDALNPRPPSLKCSFHIGNIANIGIDHVSLREARRFLDLALWHSVLSM